MTRQFSLQRSVGALVAAALPLLLASVVRAQTLHYSFDDLTPGPLSGQKGWQADSSVIQTGTGSDTSQVFASTPPGATGAGGGIHVNDGFFGFPTLNGKGVIFGFDFCVQDTTANLSDAYIALSTPGKTLGIGNPGCISIEYTYDIFSTEDRLLGGTGSGASIANGYHNFTDVRGHWYHVEDRIDFTAFGGNGAESLFYQDLTASGALQPVITVQNIEMALIGMPVTPDQWTRVEIGAANSQIDNLVIESIPSALAAAPEPAALLLLGLTLPVLRRMRRRAICPPFCLE